MIARFFEELGEVLDALNRDPARGKKAGVSYTSLVLAVLALTFLASFARGLYVPTLVLSFSLLLALVLGVDLRSWAKLVALVFAMTMIISAPLIGYRLATSGWDPSAIRQPIEFVARCTSATSVLAVGTLHVGWRGWLIALRTLKVPKELLWMFSTFVITVPVLLREASKLMLARTCRILKDGGLLDTWRLLASVAGDLLIRSYERVWRLERAMIARGFDVNNLPPPEELKPRDLAVILASILIALFLSL